MLEWSAPADSRIRVTILKTDKLNEYTVLWHLLRCSTLYLSMQPEFTTLEVLQQQLLAACRAQGMGDIRAAKYLVLTECDLIPAEVLAVFLKRLLYEADHLHIVISTRLPYTVRLDDALMAQTRFFPDDRLFMGEKRSAYWTLEVNAFGMGQVISQGRLIDNWKGDLTRNLFYFLLNKPIVQRDEISRAFWKYKAPAEATNLFHVSRLRLRNILGVELLDYSRGYYRLSSRIHLIYDVNEFLNLLDQSHTSADDEAMQLLERAIRLYRGSYVDWLDFESAATVRKRCEENFCDALVRLACLYLQRGEADRAAGLLARASRVQMGREDIVRQIMQIYLDQGKPADALQAFLRLEARINASADRFRPTQELLQLAVQAGYRPNLPPVYCR